MPSSQNTDEAVLVCGLGRLTRVVEADTRVSRHDLLIVSDPTELVERFAERP